MSFLRGDLPATCLLRLVTAGEHMRSPRSIYVEQIKEVLEQALHKTFQSRSPQDEHEVQDAAEAALTAVQARLNRALPLLPFAGISTRPDFSTSTGKVCASWLFVEKKYLKHRQRLSRSSNLSLLFQFDNRCAPGSGAGHSGDSGEGDGLGAANRNMAE